ncbi:glucosyl transferase family 2 [Clostridia bacterium]|nr:glucosyl transferase family 2 [Clostridia bacterium]
MDKELITLVVPCYNEEDALPVFYESICTLADEMPFCGFEFLFVDDGSRDNTLKVIKELHSADCRVSCVSFSRNFGKEAAIYAGLQNAARGGGLVALMDADGQDPPELLKEMYKAIKEEGYDCVGTRRSTRKGEAPIRSFFAKKFYVLINKIGNVEIVDGARDYRLMTRQMVDAILQMSEYNRFSKGIFVWVGFRTKYLSYENVERVAGQTAFSFWKLFLYAIEGVLAFSTAPLAFASVFGVIASAGSVAALIVIIIQKLAFGNPVSGWASTIVIVLFLFGLQFLFTGIIGMYLSKVYSETKKRPIYLAKEIHRSVDSEE